MTNLTRALLFALALTLVVQGLTINRLTARVKAMEDIVINNAVEAALLARKMEELKVLNDEGKQEHVNQLAFAVAGFRTGSYRAYEAIVASREGM